MWKIANKKIPSTQKTASALPYALSLGYGLVSPHDPTLSIKNNVGRRILGTVGAGVSSYLAAKENTKNPQDFEDEHGNFSKTKYLKKLLPPLLGVGGAYVAGHMLHYPLAAMGSEYIRNKYKYVPTTAAGRELLAKDK